MIVPAFSGKCASLARMIACGVHVPGGFAAKTDAYDRHLRSNGLCEVIADRLSHVAVDNIDHEEALAGEIRGVILAQVMPVVAEPANKDIFFILLFIAKS